MLENLYKKLFECYINYYYIHYFAYILVQTLSYLIFVLLLHQVSSGQKMERRLTPATTLS